MRKLDRDFDGLITKEEFTRAGPDGLPSFEQYGKNVLGHHYGAHALLAFLSV